MPDSAPQLLRKPYHSSATGDQREFLLYLPRGYGDDDRDWPVMLFLHGGGERGDGRDDLDFVLRHGPLGEAWLRHRDLPFIIIGPQLPVFGMDWQVELRAGVPKPARDEAGPQPCEPEKRSDRPMVRGLNPAPTDVGVTEAWGDDGAPGGWQLCTDDLLAMVDSVLDEYQADPKRVYLTGLSYGGYGSWHLAMHHPERWAAVATLCGDGNSAAVNKLAAAQTPIWIFHGGRDIRVKPDWIYDVANALEQAGHTSVRITIHEDMGHDVWLRVYGGRDLYDWLLEHALP